MNIVTGTALVQYTVPGTVLYILCTVLCTVQYVLMYCTVQYSTVLYSTRTVPGTVQYGTVASVYSATVIQLYKIDYCTVKKDVIK